MLLTQVFGTLILSILCANGFANETDKSSSSNATLTELLTYKRYSIPLGYAGYSITRSQYKFHIDPQTWQTARRICLGEGGYLAIINSEQEATFLLDLMKQYPASVLDNSIIHKDYAFIGFHDLFQEGEYVTVDGESLESSGYVHWAPGQPDNAGGNENCGSLWRNGGLNDIPCFISLPYICEIPPNGC